MEIRHLSREAKTALELAIAALAPSELIDRLAMAAGLLDAIAEFAMDAAPTLPLIPKTIERARKSLDDWRVWGEKHLPKATA
jgi:hypothetical protein